MQSNEYLPEAARKVWLGSMDCGLHRENMSREREFNAEIPTRQYLFVYKLERSSPGESLDFCSRMLQNLARVWQKEEYSDLHVLVRSKAFKVVLQHDPCVGSACLEVSAFVKVSKANRRAAAAGNQLVPSQTKDHLSNFQRWFSWRGVCGFLCSKGPH